MTALTSTDEGVGFLVKRKGQCLYHAGDLHWWHWEGELEEENRAMARRYWEQIDRLRGETIDVAFLPADPRQGEAGLWGLRYFLRTVGVKTAAPMHCWGDERWMDRIAADPLLAGFRNRLLLMRREGDCVRLEKNKSGEHIFFPSKM